MVGHIRLLRLDKVARMDLRSIRQGLEYSNHYFGSEEFQWCDYILCQGQTKDCVEQMELYRK
jgi:hypothetical protein